ncbi:hypothetical protein BaRGS_00009652 [Batillaria attramentaria]|uniref:HTH CENPB-type domain-containing protein n=1 Tax=Batillaria attramentaria TaxID=370345 RepID=A0ABD0LI55_9CAEN
MASRKRKVLTLEQRVKVIELSEKGDSARKIAEKMDVGKTQIQSILLAKEEIKQEWKDGAPCTRKYKRARHMLYGDIDAAVWEWFCSARAKGMPVSGPLLQQKAMMFSVTLGHDEFTASNGWLQCFKNRHNIRAAALSGESGEVNEADVTDWLKRVPALIQEGGYTPDNIFNVDETGLFFRALPDKTLAQKGERCHGRKKSKDRFTVMLGHRRKTQAIDHWQI